MLTGINTRSGPDILTTMPSIGEVGTQPSYQLGDESSSPGPIKLLAAVSSSLTLSHNTSSV
jgi:hypothetical protein